MEAVRKYREKKKARTTSLEDEVLRLRTLNQQHMKRVHGQAALEAEIGSFSNDKVYCLHRGMDGRSDMGGGAGLNQNSATKDLPIYEVGNSISTEVFRGSSKRKCDSDC
ncbi:Basic leucine zipper 23 [Linum perenne]